MSNHTELSEFLASKGYKTYPVADYETCVLSNWQVQLDFKPLCRCNDRSFVNVALYENRFHDGSSIRSAKIEIVGETPSGDWATINFYSLRWEEFRAKHDELQSRLIAAWLAASKEECDGAGD